MNFGKSALKARQSGNAMIYILLALALLGLLTASLMSQDSSGGDDISKDQVEFQTTEILSYAAAAQTALDQMIATGTDPNTIDFMMPSATSFDTAPHINKFYHPQGGGFNYKTPNPAIFTGTGASPSPGWYINRFNNIAWTPTTANDILLSAFKISQPVCASINKKLTGSTTIPTLGVSIGNTLVGLQNGGAANTNIANGDCAACVGKPALCVTNSTADAWAFYSIILGQ